MPRPRWYLHGGVRATAVISPVGLVHPNIHMSFNRTSDLPLMTAASKMVRPSPEARYRSLRTPSWSCAKKFIASSERNATSRYFGLHWRWILAAGNSSLFLGFLGAMESTSPKMIFHFPPLLWWSPLLLPMQWVCLCQLGLLCDGALHYAVIGARPFGPSWGRNAKASHPPVTLQCPNPLPLYRYINLISCMSSRIGPALCWVRPLSL